MRQTAAAAAVQSFFMEAIIRWRVQDDAPYLFVRVGKRFSVGRVPSDPTPQINAGALVRKFPPRITVESAPIQPSSTLAYTDRKSVS